jgi:hypothetical protein
MPFVSLEDGGEGGERGRRQVSKKRKEDALIAVAVCGLLLSS